MAKKYTVYIGVLTQFFIQVINRLIFNGSEPSSAQSIDHDIHWLACAFQCILVSKIRCQLLVTSAVVMLTPFDINGVCY